tara:strand:- start:1067 stop:1450 length:384 start_codon:yes stop_codon:yes gene_type:complete
VNWAKILQFCLKHWKEITVVVSLLAVSIKTRMDYHALNKAYEISQEETKERIEALQYIHSEELARRDYAIEQYKDSLEELTETFEKSQRDLEEERQKKTKQFEQQFSQDKEALTSEIISTFNFEYLE